MTQKDLIGVSHLDEMQVDKALVDGIDKPTDEKRMVVVLAPERYQEWLQARCEQSMAFMRPFAAAALAASVDTNSLTKT